MHLFALGYFLYNTILSFCGDPRQPPGAPIKWPVKDVMTPERKAMEAGLYGKQGAKEKRKEVREQVKYALCEGCRLNEGQVEGRPQFMVCKVCAQKLQRKIFYCSVYVPTSLPFIQH
jgi:hypothetical protein